MPSPSSCPTCGSLLFAGTCITCQPKRTTLR